MESSEAKIIQIKQKLTTRTQIFLNKRRRMNKRDLKNYFFFFCLFFLLPFFNKSTEISFCFLFDFCFILSDSNKMKTIFLAFFSNKISINQSQLLIERIKLAKIALLLMHLISFKPFLFADYKVLIYFKTKKSLKK